MRHNQRVVYASQPKVIQVRHPSHGGEDTIFSAGERIVRPVQKWLVGYWDMIYEPGRSLELLRSASDFLVQSPV